MTAIHRREVFTFNNPLVHNPIKAATLFTFVKPLKYPKLIEYLVPKRDSNNLKDECYYVKSMLDKNNKVIRK